jgi:hypothetical protein
MVIMVVRTRRDAKQRKCEPVSGHEIHADDYLQSHLALVNTDIACPLQLQSTFRPSETAYRDS